MAKENNFLLGHGERLTSKVEVGSGGGKKNPPYPFPQARARVADMARGVSSAFANLPSDACPRDEAVALMSLHPRYLAKTEYPETLLRHVGLRAVGSRTKRISPEHWGTKQHPEEAITESYFVAGPRTAFAEWAVEVESWGEREAASKDLTKIENFEAPTIDDKLRSIPTDQDEALFEFVVHDADDREILEAFLAFAEAHGAIAYPDRIRNVHSLSFFPVRTPVQALSELARFSFVRVARGMPSLRPFQPVAIRAAGQASVTLPAAPRNDVQHRALVFDGGLPDDHALQPWVTYVESDGIGRPTEDLVGHGLAVTSALLFGSLAPGTRPPEPQFHVDHVRVLDATSASTDMEIIDVLDRINAYLDDYEDQYEFVNISLGPDLAVEDDEVTLWTASLDERFAHGRAVASVAAGNNGEMDNESGLNRVQVPADGVNVVSVGSADSPGQRWSRASYSGVGPGRTPGRVKPDVVVFGGSQNEPFHVLKAGPSPATAAVQGTSFAAPLALRTMLGTRILLSTQLSGLAVNALLVHQAERGPHDIREVGWGRPSTDALDLITCDDHEATVVFQGQLPIGTHLRVPVPIGRVRLRGFVTIRATLMISPEVDPAYPGSYTRSGIQVVFRPHDQRFGDQNGQPSEHPVSKPFFSPSKMYGQEIEYRTSGRKWEPCLKHSQRFQASSLSNPVFDIYYHNRSNGAQQLSPRPIPYAMFVSVEAPATSDLYNQVVRAHANILTPLQPVARVRVAT